MRRFVVAAIMAAAALVATAPEAKTLRAALAGADPTEMPIRAFLQDPLEIYWCP